jgi:predicted NUDIX family phosphoesterase
MSTVAEEQVLVVPTELFHQLGHFQGFSGEVDRYFQPLLASHKASYRPRGAMEADASFKQLIPYVLFRYRDPQGDILLFDYLRGGGGGEARLRAKRSVGVGGHISSDDLQVAGRNDVYRKGMMRELEEEVLIDTAYAESLAGLLNDDETDVGRVHLGVVHIFDVETPAVSPREQDIADAGFRPVRQILDQLDHYETWSQIVVRALFG